MPKKVRASSLYQATVAEIEARKALRAARKNNDARATAAAESKLAQAQEAIVVLHLRRFERSAKFRGDTAANAILEIIKLVRQRRYKITAMHATAIMGPLQDILVELDTALKAALRRDAEWAPRRRIDFGNSVGEGA